MLTLSCIPWALCVASGMIMLEACVVVYLLQGHAASGRQVSAAAAGALKEVRPANSLLGVPANFSRVCSSSLLLNLLGLC